MIKKIIFVAVFILFTSNVFSQVRSFDDIFPNISANNRASAFTNNGYVRASQRQSGFVIIGRSQGSGIAPELISNVLNRGPGYLVESIIVIPGQPGSVTLLDVYNALGNIRDLKGRLYDSHSKGREVPLFEDATRIVSERNTSAIADPPAASVLPQRETIFIRLRDVNFGNTYYRGEMVLVQNGLRYTMSNFRSMSYLMVPVIREDKFVAQLYFEPIAEGILIYSIAGADISDFFASRIHVDSAISKRLSVITSWAGDGISRRRR